MTLDQKFEFEVTKDHRKVLLLVEGDERKYEIFHVPVYGEEIGFVLSYENNLAIAADRGCCPPGTAYVLEQKHPDKGTYDFKEAYATGLPIQAILPVKQGVLTVAQGCYSGVRLTRRDGTQTDLVDDETYQRIRHYHEHRPVNLGSLGPKFLVDGDKIVLQLELFGRQISYRREAEYALAKQAGEAHRLDSAPPTDIYKSWGIVEQIDLTEKLAGAGVTAQEVIPSRTIYDWFRMVFVTRKIPESQEKVMGGESK